MLRIEMEHFEVEPKARLALTKIDIPKFRQAVMLRLARRQELCLEKEGTITPEAIDAVVSQLQTSILEALHKHCPIARPSQYARQAWSTECSNLVHAHRAARRRYAAGHNQADEAQYKALRNQLKKQLRKESRNTWRGFVAEATEQGHNAGLWRLSKWAKKKAGKPRELPHLPPLRRDIHSPYAEDNKEKAQILAERFFPPPVAADLADIGVSRQGEPAEQIQIDIGVTAAIVQEIIQQLPSKKAPGPDGITNEVLKLCSSEISSCLADIAQACFRIGYHPREFWFTTTVVLRKEGKLDYSVPGSYRPIALEDTLGKVLEKLVAIRLSAAAEENNLLPQSQMGARRSRSTLSALSLLVDVVHTAWARNPNFVVSMLSLDLSGAFDRVSHSRLLWILQKKRLPQWVIGFIQGFLTDRRTQLAFSGFTSEVIETPTGIPQGSPLSPILFLFFASELLEMFDNANSTVGLGFVDDTNLLVWGL